MWHAVHKNSIPAENAFPSSSLADIYDIDGINRLQSRRSELFSSFRSVRSIGFRLSRMRVFTRREEKVHPKRRLRRSFISRDSKPDRAYTFSPSVCFVVPHLPKHGGHHRGIRLPSKTGARIDTQVRLR